MKDLKCGLRECVYNRAYSCTAKQILVEKSTDCATFRRDETKRSKAFEAAEDFAARDFSVDTHVKCGADCMFNKDKVCHANGITVMGDHKKDAMCLTYIQK